MNKINKLFNKLYKNTVLYFFWKWNNAPIYNKMMYKYLKKLGVTIKGIPRYIDYTAWIDSTDYPLLILGEGVVISRNVTLLVHDLSIINARIAAEYTPYKPHNCHKSISIGDNCFIGANSIILPGGNIGNHCIVGAGSVVRGCVEPYSVVIGNPAVKVGDVRKFAKKREKA